MYFYSKQYKFCLFCFLFVFILLVVKHYIWGSGSVTRPLHSNWHDVVYKHVSKVFYSFFWHVIDNYEFQIHKHSKRVNHMPIQLRCSDSPRSAGSATTILRLVGVIALNGGHYTSYSEPYVESNKKLTESQMLVDETEWYYFNSKESMQGKSWCCVG